MNSIRWVIESETFLNLIGLDKDKNLLDFVGFKELDLIELLGFRDFNLLRLDGKRDLNFFELDGFWRLKLT